VNEATAKAFSLAGEPRGALVTDVTSGSPAEHAGLVTGDIVLEIDGTPVKDSRDLSLAVAAKSPGSAIRLNVFRKGQTRDFNVTLGEQPSKPGARGEGRGEPPAGTGLGLSVQTLTPEVARQLDLPIRTRGVIVTDVDMAGPAEDAGLTRGDVIIEVNHKPIASAQEFQAALREAGKQPVLFLIQRSSGRMFVVVQPK
jgi:S1-C subfamily serine protease